MESLQFPIDVLLDVAPEVRLEKVLNAGLDGDIVFVLKWIHIFQLTELVNVMSSARIAESFLVLLVCNLRVLSTDWPAIKRTGTTLARCERSFFVGVVIVSIVAHLQVW